MSTQQQRENCNILVTVRCPLEQVVIVAIDECSSCVTYRAFGGSQTYRTTVADIEWLGASEERWAAVRDAVRAWLAARTPAARAADLRSSLESNAAELTQQGRHTEAADRLRMLSAAHGAPEPQ